MRDGRLDLLNTTDARRWAEEFLRTFSRCPLPDLETLIPWFANAIETGRRFGHVAPQTSKVLEEKAEQERVLADDPLVPITVEDVQELRSFLKGLTEEAFELANETNVEDEPQHKIKPGEFLGGGGS